MNTELRRLTRQNNKYTRDLMWVPVRGKETEVWAARSPDGKRVYNVRRERIVVGAATVAADHVDMWMAVWANESDKIPNVVGTKFMSRWEAQSMLEQIESGFVVDPKEVAEERRRLASLSPDEWSFQGVYDGMSIWTRREGEKTYVIINDIIRRPHQYSLSIRWFTEMKGTTTKLHMESLGVYDTLEKAKTASMRLTKQ